MGFLGEAGDGIAGGKPRVFLDPVGNQAEEVGFSDAARADEKEVVAGLPGGGAAQDFQGVREQVVAGDGDVAPVFGAGQAGAVEAEMGGLFRHSIFSTRI